MDIDRRTFLGAAAAGVGLAGFTPRRLFRDPEIIGHGEHRFRVVPGWGVQDPAKIPVRDCHEMVQAPDGRLFMFGNETRNNMLIFNKDGRVLETWGDAYPGGHGLTLTNENGEAFLFLTDYDRHQVIKTTLDGRVVMTVDAPLDADQYTDAEQYKPTETAVAPNGDFYVADGYGSQYLIHYSHRGDLLGVHAGPGSDDGLFNNMHGVCVDTRGPEPTLILTARAQNRFKRFTLDGKHIGTVELPGAWICRPVIAGDLLLFAVIISATPTWQNNRSGFLAILDRNDRVISCPGGAAPLYDAEGKLQPLAQADKTFMHPHDVCVDDDANLYVPQWNSDQTYPIKLERVT